MNDKEEARALYMVNMAMLVIYSRRCTTAREDRQTDKDLGVTLFRYTRLD